MPGPQRAASERQRDPRPEKAVGGNPEAMRVYMLGGFRVSVGWRTIGEGAWRLKKVSNLVKLLALASGHRTHREQATESLWPDLNPEAATNNLHQALHVALSA